MAVVNANYEFLYCDIGTNGRISDGGVIENTKFYEYLVNDRLELPLPKKKREMAQSTFLMFLWETKLLLCARTF
jgi:hypothetical protein